MKARQAKKQSAAPVEVCASFSYKLNHGIRGGAQYESSDHFQSMKTTVPAAEADAMAEKLRAACRRDVLKAANEQVESLRNGVWEKHVEPHTAAKTNAAAFERSRAPRSHAMLQGEKMASVMAGSEVEHNDAYRK